MDPVGADPEARTYRLLAGPEHRRLLFEAGRHHWLVRPQRLARLLPALALSGVGLALLGIPLVVAVLVALTFVVLVAAVTGWLYCRRLTAALDRSWADGGEHLVTHDRNGFLSRGPLGAVEYRLPLIRSLEEDRGVVRIRLVGSPMAMMVPAELFPADEQRRLREALDQRSISATGE